MHLLPGNQDRIDQLKTTADEIGKKLDELTQNTSPTTDLWRRDIILMEIVGLCARQNITMDGLLADIYILKEEIEIMQLKQK